MARVGRSPRFWIGGFLAVVLLAVALRGVALEELRVELSHAAYWWLVPVAASIVVGQVMRAARWQVLFGDSPRPGIGAAWAILSVGYLLNNILPLRVGDPVRAWLVHTRTPGDGAQALATIVVERVVDLLTILLLLGVWVPDTAAHVAQQVLHIGPWLSPGVLRAVCVGVAAATFVALALLSGMAPLAEAWSRRALGWLRVSRARAEWVSAGIGRFVAGFAPMRKPRFALPTVLWSVAIWVVGAVGYWLVFRSFDLDLPMAAAVFAVCAAAVFAAVLPPSPGYVGSFHTAIREALVLYAGVSAVKAASYAIVLHGVTLVVLVVTGVVAAWWLGLSMASIDRAVGQTESAEGQA